MNPRMFATLLLAVFLATRPAAGHPAPFSYVDVRVGPDMIEVSIVAHVFDLAHDLHIEPQDRLLDTAFLAERSAAIAALLGARVQVAADGRSLAPASWSTAEAITDRQAVRIRTQYGLHESPGVLTLHAQLFPYDPAHQTFVNVYERNALALQAILDPGRPILEYYPGSREGAFAVARRFTPVGVRHVLTGADHLVFLVGLLLLGGTRCRIRSLIWALIAASGTAWLLTWLSLLHPPARIIEPAVALCLVYLGTDNLMVRGGRDLRTGIAFAFGLIHGFWFANGLRSLDLPSASLGWSLLAFDLGVEAAHVLVIVAAGLALGSLRSRNPTAAHRLAVAGSLGLVVAGAYWFIERVFFPTGFP